jgi:hypothetical protein
MRYVFHATYSDDQEQDVSLYALPNGEGVVEWRPGHGRTVLGRRAVISMRATMRAMQREGDGTLIEECR